MRRGFAILELPFVLLALLAMLGAGFLLATLAVRGGMTAGAWVAVVLMVPFVALAAWLAITNLRSARQLDHARVDEAHGREDA